MTESVRHELGRLTRERRPEAVQVRPRAVHDDGPLGWTLSPCWMRTRKDWMLAIAILGLAISGRELLIAGVVIVVVAAIVWFVVRRR